MPVIRYNQEILTNRFRKKFKRVDFGSKNGPFTSFWAKQEFSQQKGSATFQCSLNPKPHAKNQCEKGATGGLT